MKYLFILFISIIGLKSAQGQTCLEAGFLYVDPYQTELNYVPRETSWFKVSTRDVISHLVFYDYSPPEGVFIEIYNGNCQESPMVLSTNVDIGSFNDLVVFLDVAHLEDTLYVHIPYDNHRLLVLQRNTCENPLPIIGEDAIITPIQQWYTIDVPTQQSVKKGLRLDIPADAYYLYEDCSDINSPFMSFEAEPYLNYPYFPSDTTTQLLIYYYRDWRFVYDFGYNTPLYGTGGEQASFLWVDSVGMSRENPEIIYSDKEYRLYQTHFFEHTVERSNSKIEFLVNSDHYFYVMDSMGNKLLSSTYLSDLYGPPYIDGSNTLFGAQEGQVINIMYDYVQSPLGDEEGYKTHLKLKYEKIEDGDICSKPLEVFEGNQGRPVEDTWYMYVTKRQCGSNLISSISGEWAWYNDFFYEVYPDCNSVSFDSRGGDVHEDVEDVVIKSLSKGDTIYFYFSNIGSMDWKLREETVEFNNMCWSPIDIKENMTISPEGYTWYRYKVKGDNTILISSIEANLEGEANVEYEIYSGPCSDRDNGSKLLAKSYGSMPLEAMELTDLKRGQDLYIKFYCSENVEWIITEMLPLQISSEQVDGSSILIYPNPATNAINISFSLSQPSLSKIIINELSGKEVFASQLANLAAGENNVNLTLGELNLRPGIYLISLIKENDKTLHGRLIVKH